MCVRGHTAQDIYENCLFTRLGSAAINCCSTLSLLLGLTPSPRPTSPITCVHRPLAGWLLALWRKSTTSTATAIKIHASNAIYYFLWFSFPLENKTNIPLASTAIFLFAVFVFVCVCPPLYYPFKHARSVDRTLVIAIKRQNISSRPLKVCPNTFIAV